MNSASSPFANLRIEDKLQPQTIRTGQFCLCLCLALSLLIGCQKSTRNKSDIVIEKMRANSGNSSSEALRQGIRNLMQTNQINKKDMTDETRVLINAWLKSADAKSINYSPSKLLDSIDTKLLSAVSSESPEANQLSGADIECLYEAKVMRTLSEWIVAAPVRDRLFQPMLTAKMSELKPESAVKLEQAYKLFDWTIRNIMLAGTPSSQTNNKTRDPRGQIVENGVGYSYLPWEAALFSQADFIVRGRVFAGLARQQGIETCWISVGSAPGAAGDLFCMGILIENQLLLVETKLGIPILDPDTDAWATLQDVAKNEKILRRLNLPQYEYAYQKSDIVAVQLLIDATPFTLSLRAKLLESGLVGNERMTLYVDADVLADQLNKAAPNSTVSVWNIPVMAQAYAIQLQERLKETSMYTMKYMAEHLIWLVEGSDVATGRNLHLSGKFENSPEGLGALKTYIDTRVDDASLKRMSFNPDVQRSLGIERDPNETQQMYDARVLQAIAIFSRAKFDAAFLLGQLHFDRGDYKSSMYWLSERLLPDKRAQLWYTPGWYTLARAAIELGKYDVAEDALTKPSVDASSNQPAYVVNPQDAGNRIRLRYLKRLVTGSAEQPK